MSVDSSFLIAKKLLLDPTGLTENNLYQVLTKTLGAGINYADLYLQYSQSESWILEEGLIKKGSFAIDRGVGVRAISGETTGFSYTTDLVLPTMEEAAFYARSIATSGQTSSVKLLQYVQPERYLYQPINPLDTLTENEKVSLLRVVDTTARNFDSRVTQVNADLTGSYNIVMIATADGNLVADVRPLIRLNVSVLVEENGCKERGSYGGGKRAGYQMFLRDKLAEKYACEAVRIALVNLHATPAPAGQMPVVLGNGWPGIMLHEAVGHGLEADFNRKKCSVYSDKIGEKVATATVTVIDQGNLLGECRGSLNVDDEGIPTQRTVLIENGTLRNYMYDRLNADLMGTKSTGNGRRASYAQIPIPRMTNTYMLAGDYDSTEIISSVDRGIYAVNFSGGQVDITSGEFVFSISEAYLIERGKVTMPIKGATLIGNGPAVLNKIVMVGNDLEFDNGVGTCGKGGQNVAVGIGQPTLKISELIVGGTLT